MVNKKYSQGFPTPTYRKKPAINMKSVKIENQFSSFFNKNLVLITRCYRLGINKLH